MAQWLEFITCISRKFMIGSVVRFRLWALFFVSCMQTAVSTRRVLDGLNRCVLLHQSLFDIEIRLISSGAGLLSEKFFSAEASLPRTFCFSN